MHFEKPTYLYIKRAVHYFDSNADRYAKVTAAHLKSLTKSLIFTPSMEYQIIHTQYIYLMGEVNAGGGV